MRERLTSPHMKVRLEHEPKLYPVRVPKGTGQFSAVRGNTILNPTDRIHKQLLRENFPLTAAFVERMLAQPEPQLFTPTDEEITTAFALLSEQKLSRKHLEKTQEKGVCESFG